MESLLRAAKEKPETSSTVALPTLLYVSMGGKGPYASEGPGEMTERQMDEYLEKLHRHRHELADEQLDIIIRRWLHKMLDILSIQRKTMERTLEKETEPVLATALQSLAEYDRLLQPLRAKASS